MYCGKCGSQIDGDSVFCKKCGAKQNVILSANETKEKSDNEEMTEQEILGNTYPDEPTASVKKEPNNDIDQDRNKKRKINWSARIIIGVILILIGLGLAFKDAIFYGGLFKGSDALSKLDYESFVWEHMHDVHKVSMGANESLDEAQVDLNDTSAIVRFKVYRSVDGIYLEMPNTMQLDKKGKVVSCEWCRLGINDEQDDVTSANPEPNFDQTFSADELVPSPNLNDSNGHSFTSICPRCRRALTDGEISCDCTWCDICNAWMLGHGHEEGAPPVDSSTAQSSTDSTSVQSGTGSTADYDYSFAGQEITILRYKGSGGDVVIPTTIDGKRVTKIGNEAFDSGINDHIKSVIIPNGVTEIGTNAFRFNYGLNSITIPESVVHIGDLAFDETNVSSIYFEGNAPTGTGVLSHKSVYKVFYKSGTTGWDNEIWSDFPKEVW